MFEQVEAGPIDPMFELKTLADSDTFPDKIDLGVGVYRSEKGGYHELGCIKSAKEILDQAALGHDVSKVVARYYRRGLTKTQYESTIGNGKFLAQAAQTVFGKDSNVLTKRQVSSVQTISGTGACHLGALLLQKVFLNDKPGVYIGTPTWGNYDPLFRLVGFNDIVTYPYYSREKGNIDFVHMLDVVRNAPKGSIFVLQACCHNPTGMDLSRVQWKELANEIEAGNHFPFFDMAYQGLGDSLDNDAWAVRHFVSKGFETMVCQSYSKNFGLYGERCGALHVVTEDVATSLRVKDRLRSLIRWEFSSSPAYGSRLVTIISNDEALRKDWIDELNSIQARLKSMRSQLYTALAEERKLPGNWNNIQESRGLFCFLPLTPRQCQILVHKHHIYLPSNGRINISGLTPSKLDRFASAVQSVLAIK